MNNKQQNSIKQITTDKDQTIVIYDNDDKYVGNWKDGKREGKGVYYFKSCAKYDGYWKDNKKEGKGVYYFKSGNRYEGDKTNKNVLSNK